MKVLKFGNNNKENEKVKQLLNYGRKHDDLEAVEAAIKILIKQGKVDKKEILEVFKVLEKIDKENWKKIKKVDDPQSLRMLRDKLRRIDSITQSLQEKFSNIRE